MLRIFLSLFIVIGLSTTSLSADTRDERLEIAKNYIAATVEDMDFDRLIRNMWQPIIDQVSAGGQTVTEEQKEEIHAMYVAEFGEPLRNLMLEQDEIMADVYTLEEIVAMRDFYATPAGRAAITKMPLLMERQQPIILELVMSRIPQLMPKLGQIIGGN